MSTPEKPRPSLDDTVAHIDAALAEPNKKLRCVACGRQALTGLPFCPVHRRLPCAGIGLLDAEPPVVRDGNTFTINTPGVYEMTWNPGSSGEPSVAERALERAADPDPDPALVRQAVVDAIAHGDVHRAARQSAAQLAATTERHNAALTEPRHLSGAPGPTCPGCQSDAERPGWLARIRRLFT